MDVSYLCWYGANLFCQVHSWCFPFRIKKKDVSIDPVSNEFTRFSSVLPALAFILDMNRRTGGFYGVNEALFSSALACMVFSLIGAQPLTVVGITGLISLFNYTIFDIIKRYDVTLYPQFMTWVAIWTAIFHWIFAFLNFCDYMRYVTDFSSQSFGAYVGIIYCIKGVELLIGEFESYGPTKGFMDVMIALLFFFSVYMLELVGKSVLFVPSARAFLGDYAYPVRIHRIMVTLRG